MHFDCNYLPIVERAESCKLARVSGQIQSTALALEVIRNYCKMNSFKTIPLTDQVMYATSTGDDLQDSYDEVALAQGFIYPSVYFGDWEIPVVSRYQTMPMSQVQLMPSKAETPVPVDG